MRNTVLTQREKELINQIACDHENGNYLIRPRTDEYWAFRKDFCDAAYANELTERQADILEYYRQCSDYSYWKNLPDDEKMF